MSTGSISDFDTAARTGSTRKGRVLWMLPVLLYMMWEFDAADTGRTRSFLHFRLRNIATQKATNSVV